MNNAAERLLSKLSDVRASGPNRWMAKCPAHEDGRASLSILDTGEGRLLVHCFASCTAGDVVSAVGLGLADLFERPITSADKQFLPPIRFPINATDALIGLQHESLVVVIVAEKIARGEGMNVEEHKRLIKAACAINSTVAKVALPEAIEMKRIRRGETPVSA